MFSKDTLLSLLGDLSSAQESIEKVSVWLQQYKEDAADIVLVWKTYFLEVSKEKKLNLLYLVNDVIQNSKRKGPHFVEAFGHILPKCLAECRDHEHKDQIQRMLDIWESREIFHKHVMSAMKYNIDDIGMTNATVELADLMNVVDQLIELESQSSEVLTKLSIRLDATDFANAFNVTSRKEGDKYAADFDETANFLDDYCTCLSKQTRKRIEMLQKVNTTLYQMEKDEESLHHLDRESKFKQSELVRTRKAISSRLMMIEEGMVDFGDDSPKREEIENLTSEEEDVDIEGIETSEIMKKKIYASVRLEIVTRFSRYMVAHNFYPSNSEPIIYLMEAVFCYCSIQYFYEFTSVYLSRIPYTLLSCFKAPKFKQDLVIQNFNRRTVYVLTVHGHSDLPGELKPNLNSTSNQEKFGPQLPSQMKCEIPVQKYGPPTAFVEAESSNVTDSNNSNISDYCSKQSPSQMQSNSSDNINIKEEVSSIVPSNSVKFGPSLPVGFINSSTAEISPTLDLDQDKLPALPDNCHTTIDRLLHLYSLETDPPLDECTNLQQVFGGKTRGYDPECKVLQSTETEGRDNEMKVECHKEQLNENNCTKSTSHKQPDKEAVIKDFGGSTKISKKINSVSSFGLGKFELPKFSSFPITEVENAIHGNIDAHNSKRLKRKIKPSLQKPESNFKDTVSEKKTSSDFNNRKSNSPISDHAKSQSEKIEKQHAKSENTRNGELNSAIAFHSSIERKPMQQMRPLLDPRMRLDYHPNPMMHAPYDPMHDQQNHMMPGPPPIDPRMPINHMMPGPPPIDPRMPINHMMPGPPPIDPRMPINHMMPGPPPIDPRMPMNYQPNPMIREPPPFHPRMPMNNQLNIMIPTIHSPFNPMSHQPNPMMPPIMHAAFDPRLPMNNTFPMNPQVPPRLPPKMVFRPRGL